MHFSESTHGRLRTSRRIQSFLERRVAKGSSSAERLLALTEFVGFLAWHCHAGRFVAERAESALRQDLRLTPSDSLGLRASVTGRTVHVLTEAYGVGGHTRLVRHWIDRAGADRHAVVLTRQTLEFKPHWLVDAGHDVPILDLLSLGIRERVTRASVLMALFDAAERVVLHVHPDDAVAIAAAMATGERDIRFLNHADHAAWLGASLSTGFINFRSQGVRLSVDRRGIDEARCDIVPLPIEAPVALSRRDARASLGFSDSEQLLLTVGWDYKYVPVEGYSLLGPLACTLSRTDARLIAIGPRPDNPLFAQLSEQFPGRVHLPGALESTAAYRAAADVYVDSFPFGGATALLEAVVLGVPAFCFQPQRDQLEVMYTQWAGADLEPSAADTDDEFASLIQGVLDSPAAESRRAALIEASSVHYGDRWRGLLETHLHRRFRGRAWAPPPPRSPDQLDLMLAALGRDPRKFPSRAEGGGLSRRDRLRLLSLQLAGNLFV